MRGTKKRLEVQSYELASYGRALHTIHKGVKMEATSSREGQMHGIIDPRCFGAA